VDQELLLRNEYLAAENQILRAQLKGRLRLSDAERTRLGEIGYGLGHKALGEVATAALPDTILAWYRRLVARKFEGSGARRTPGRPPIDREVEELIVRMAEENWCWGYDRIIGALANLGYVVSDQTVGNVLRRRGVPPAPQRKRTTTWVAGITVHPNEQWMQQMARNVTMEGCGALRDCRYLLHDRDTKYSNALRAIFESGQVKTRRALGEIGKRRVLVKDHSLRRALLAAGNERICCALPR
jgi:putative transposase